MKRTIFATILTISMAQVAIAAPRSTEIVRVRIDTEMKRELKARLERMGVMKSGVVAPVYDAQSLAQVSKQVSALINVAANKEVLNNNRLEASIKRAPEFAVTAESILVAKAALDKAKSEAEGVTSAEVKDEVVSIESAIDLQIRMINQTHRLAIASSAVTDAYKKIESLFPKMLTEFSLEERNSYNAILKRTVEQLEQNSKMDVESALVTSIGEDKGWRRKRKEKMFFLMDLNLRYTSGLGDLSRRQIINRTYLLMELAQDSVFESSPQSIEYFIHMAIRVPFESDSRSLGHAIQELGWKHLTLSTKLIDDLRRDSLHQENQTNPISSLMWKDYPQRRLQIDKAPPTQRELKFLLERFDLVYTLDTKLSGKNHTFKRLRNKLEELAIRYPEVYVGLNQLMHFTLSAMVLGIEPRSLIEKIKLGRVSISPLPIFENRENVIDFYSRKYPYQQVERLYQFSGYLEHMEGYRSSIGKYVGAALSNIYVYGLSRLAKESGLDDTSISKQHLDVFKKLEWHVPGPDLALIDLRTIYYYEIYSSDLFSKFTKVLHPESSVRLMALARRLALSTKVESQFNHYFQDILTQKKIFQLDQFNRLVETIENQQPIDLKHEDIKTMIEESKIRKPIKVS